MPLKNPDQLQFKLAPDEGPAYKRFLKRDDNPMSGKVRYRIIFAPNKQMKSICKGILRQLRALKLDLPYATAALPGCSPRQNVERHRGNQYFFLLDLHAAYQMVKPEIMAQILCDLAELPQNKQRVLRQLKRYCFVADYGLATGGPASPMLFNIYAGELIDKPLATLLSRWGDITYTRYLDDMTFSSMYPIGPKRRKQILSVIRAAGLEHHIRKAEVVSLPKVGCVNINGVGLRANGQLFVPREARRKLFSLLKAANAGEAISENKVNGHIGAYLGVADLKHPSKSDRRLMAEIHKYRKMQYNTPERQIKRRRRYEDFRRKRRYIQNRRQRPSRWHTLDHKWGKHKSRARHTYAPF